jgi:hypothetical protein
LNIDPDNAARIVSDLERIADNPRKSAILREAAHEALAKLRKLKPQPPLNTVRRSGV